MIRWLDRVCRSVLVLCLVSAAAHADGIAYDTRITGVDDPALTQDLAASSALQSLQSDKPPATLAALARRARDDVGRLTAVIEAAGYYEARIDPVIDEAAVPVAVDLQVRLGPLYRLGSVAASPPDGKALPLGAVDPAKIGLVIGGPAISGPIVDADARLVRLYQGQAYPFAKLVRRQITVDRATKLMDVRFTLDPGPAARFGPVEITGLSRLDPAWVRRRITWIEGAPYDQAKIDATRQALTASGLFGTVAVEPISPVTADGRVAISIKLIERAVHSLGVGASYNTTEGIGGNLSWEHRDLFGAAEDLKLTATAGTADNALLARFRRPDLWADGQDFVASLIFDDQNVNAFTSIEQKLSLGFERHFDPQWAGGLSILAEHARVNEKVDNRTYVLVGLPVFAKDNATDDLLNPTTGYRAELTATPYARALGGDLSFAQSTLTGSWYHAFDAKGDRVLALQGTLGATVGVGLTAIPKDHRFYAGGGGSVRGFGYQEAGPYDRFDNPIGGRSLALLSAEMRTRITETIGLVPFLDAGSDYPSALPDFKGRVSVGAGLGLRYYTAIGPVRLDLATPLNPRGSVDAPIQIYVSLGQAF